MKIELPVNIEITNNLVGGKNVTYKDISVDPGLDELTITVEVQIDDEDFSSYDSCPVNADGNVRNITFNAYLTATYKLNLSKLRLSYYQECEYVGDFDVEDVEIFEDGEGINDSKLEKAIIRELETRFTDNVEYSLELD